MSGDVIALVSDDLGYRGRGRARDVRGLDLLRGDAGRSDEISGVLDIGACSVRTSAHCQITACSVLCADEFASSS